MTGHVGTAEVVRFRELLARRLGWSSDGVESAQLSDVLLRRAGQGGGSVRDYLRHLDEGAPGPELAALAEALTITETYFFRNIEQFNALAEVALPARIRARADRRRLSLVSVGCASGEEAYTLAIVAREAAPDPAWDISVFGLDVNPAMLRMAGEARYSGWALRETPDRARQRWFRQRGDRFELDGQIRDTVRFMRYNAADEDPQLWPVGGYDVVFCRNLLMYLTVQTASGLLARITRAMAPGGYLFLGHTDSLGPAPPGLRVRSTHDAFYYERVAADPELPGAPRRSGSTTGPEAAAGPARPAAAPPPAVPRRPDTPVVSSRSDRDLVIGLVRDERFAEALELVRARPGARELDLVRGVVLLHLGRLDEAADGCRRILAREGPGSDALHLLATVREAAGEPAEAEEHYRIAAYLEPRFAMPRLRLGLLARRSGDRRTAAAELEFALDLLPRESDERIVLFGGGFGRHALIALCRAERNAT